MKWSKKELALLRKQRFEKPYTPYAKCPAEYLEICGTVRTQDAIRFKAYELRNEEKIEELDDEVIGVFDIETTHLKADIGFMLGWSIYYPHEGKTVSQFVTKKELTDYKFDKRICKLLLKELENIDLLVTYYGTGFDIKFSRTRCLMNGLTFPQYGSMRHKDVYYMARGKLATSRKSMGVVSEALGLDSQKTHESKTVWNLAKYGHPNSLAKIRRYCENDVLVTWLIHNELLKYGKYSAKSI
jgi:uncharacterized protein YprB with RNaseH-like and TPR domain